MGIYERMRGFFERTYASGETPWPSTEPTASVVRLAKDLQKASRRGLVLDLGCGEGRHTFLFAKNGFKAYGLDYLPLPLKLALQRAKAQKLTKGFAFVLADAHLPPFKAKSFDVLIDSGFFHHVKKSDWKHYIRNITALLKDGGSFHLTAFSTRFKHYPGEKRSRNWLVHRNHYDRFFRKSDFQKIFGDRFEILRIEEERSGLHVFWNVLMRKKKTGRLG